jgi:hypothetical protein
MHERRKRVKKKQKRERERERKREKINERANNRKRLSESDPVVLFITMNIKNYK